ncbi:MAG: protein-export chaperone SecB [Clostridiales bacterium]|nr:protein-export chaperone SecB [Clostridiales bacterium]
MRKSKFQFTDPKLERLEFVTNTKYDKDKFDGIVMESTTEVKSDDSNEAYVALTLRIGNSEEGQPFSILVRMSADFSWEQNLEKGLVESLLRSNAPAALLSYIRPIVSMITTSSGYPALNIPFIDFTKNEIDEE